MTAQKLSNRYKEILENKEALLSISISVLFFLLSLIINYFAGALATGKASSPVTDIILSNTPVLPVGGIITYGLILFWAFITFLCLTQPKKIPFILKSLALLIIIRSIFVNMTHIGIFPTHVPFNTSGLVSYFTFGGDLFFSDHTGIPFLMALVFWNQIKLRYVFLISSIIFGILMLLAHQHYTIDVLSAFFITYTIFHLAEKLFKKDREIFNQNY